MRRILMARALVARNGGDSMCRPGVRISTRIGDSLCTQRP
ncbi:hypothetical protein SZ55_1525 [Pseudomonas sp. FeS53a]|nr:hypothetical protein SZ55_1525 [Pseudomonas sp. FeS53a]